ncbi:MAG TPA: hypothetical protein VE486_07485, partial [Candidatus Baltobacteraceae bacterium]|nr:hypothetical protein [Candidatus Baltobacteraceae bacterium]
RVAKSNAALPLNFWVADNLPSDENQNTGRERQDPHQDCRDGNVEEHGDSNKDEIDRQQKHSEVFRDIHVSFLG